MKVLVIIPARFQSKRLPGKPLIELDGISLIQRVYTQVAQARGIDDIVIATENQKIYDHVLSFGGKPIMTLPDHISGTDRCLEVIEGLGDQYDYIINVQGDQPFLNPHDLENMIIQIKEQKVKSIVTLCKKIFISEDLTSEYKKDSVVKVVFDVFHQALYFSRKLLPHNTQTQLSYYFKHIGIYGFPINVLKKIKQMQLSYLENNENLEQLRWLENGQKIIVIETQYDSIDVNTQDDVSLANNYIASQKNLFGLGHLKK